MLSVALVVLAACPPPAPEPVGAKFPSGGGAPPQPYAPPNEAPAQPASTGDPGVQFAPIGTWTRSQTPDATRLEYQDRRVHYQVLILPSRPRSAPTAQWVQTWNDTIASGAFKTSLTPGPHRRRLSSGYAVYWDGEQMTTQQGVDFVTVVYLVAGKDRVLPVVGLFRGVWQAHDADLEQILEPWFETIALPGGPSADPLYAAAELVGVWKNGSASVATYVANGRVVGDASTYSSEQVELRADGQFDTAYQGTGQGTSFADKSAGTWWVDDTKLVLRDKRGTQTRRTIWNVGIAPSGARSIRLAPSYAPDANATLANPRPWGSAGWFLAP